MPIGTGVRKRHGVVKVLMKFADQLAKAGADCWLKLDALKRIVEAQ